MSYATYFTGCVNMENFPDDSLADLAFAFAGAGGFDTSESTKRGIKWGVELQAFAAPVALEDFDLLNADGPGGVESAIVGREYVGGTRRDVVRQLKLIMNWIRLKWPAVEFRGRLLLWDGENPGENPVWIQVEDNDARCYTTEITRSDEALFEI